jgi:hypothetical protein
MEAGTQIWRCFLYMPQLHAAIRHPQSGVGELLSLICDL